MIMTPRPDKIASEDMSHSGSDLMNGVQQQRHNTSTSSTSTRHHKKEAHHSSSAAAVANRQRRRPTSYTTEYTPSPHLVATAVKRDAPLDEKVLKHRKQELEQQQQQREKEERRQRRASLQEERGGDDYTKNRLAREQSARRKSNDGGGSTPRRVSSYRESSSSSPQVSSPSRKTGGPQRPIKNDMTEREIAEYAGKRAMLRLEQEFSDAANDRKKNISFHSTGSESTTVNTYLTVMDRKKLNRVPQVSKNELIIGEYLGRGNFCDVFEVEWAMKNTLGERLSGRNSYDDDSSVRSEEDADAGDSTRRKMEYLSLVCSNDIRPDIICSKDGVIDASNAPEGRSRNLRGSFSQVHTGFSPVSSSRNLRNPNVMALKCLRPAVRAQPRKFVIGAEDLAHETALLSCLDHPNIIKMYGRAKGSFATAFQFGSSKVSVSSGGSGQTKERSMNDGYFIILDILTATLDGTIDDWNEEYQGLCQRLQVTTPLPSSVPPLECNLIDHLAKRLKVAYSIASALEYLHSRHVVFRDLKPANVGFDCNDCVKMFDFGFATSIAPLLKEQIRSGREQQGYGPLTETCGTRRYMAPEVALKLGYGKEVDVYSFGMLLWEICAMEKPFDSIQSVEDFHDLVVLCGNRPPLNNHPLWTRSLKELMTRCWSTDAYDRPDMTQVKSMLCTVLRDMNVAVLKLKKLNATQSKNSGKMDETKRGSNKKQEQQPQQQQAGFLNKLRRRASIT